MIHEQRETTHLQGTALGMWSFYEHLVSGPVSPALTAKKLQPVFQLLNKGKTWDPIQISVKSMGIFPQIPTDFELGSLFQTLLVSKAVRKYYEWLLY